MGHDSSSGNKRSRAEDEVYLDNFHSHKRYLSEVMASSLNGLKVGDTASGGGLKVVPQTSDLIDSSALTDTACFSKSLSSYPSNGDDLSTLDSYMSDDSDDSICYRNGRYHENPQRTLSYLYEPSARTRQRVPDAESRFPPSPSDPCHGADLRRAALLRSLQMRAQSPVAVSDLVPPIDECLDACGQISTEAEDQFSPSSPTFDDPPTEETASNHDILGSPVHGTFCSQVGRGSTRARSLLLDECVSLVPPSLAASFTDTLSSAVGMNLSSIEEPLMSITHNQGVNFDDSNLPNIYTEEVSDSTENVENSNQREWVTTPRRGQLCNYFYRGSLGRRSTADDQ